MKFLTNIRGYTTFEAIMVIVLIGILSALTLPSLRPVIPFLNSTTIVDQIIRDLQFVKSRALADPDIHTGIFLDTAGTPDSIFFFFDNDNDNLFSREKDARLSQVIAIPPSDTLSIAAGFPEVILFRGNGSAKLSARFRVSTRKKSTTISVLASTGKIKTKTD